MAQEQILVAEAGGKPSNFAASPYVSSDGRNFRLFDSFWMATSFNSSPEMD